MSPLTHFPSLSVQTWQSRVDHHQWGEEVELQGREGFHGLAAPWRLERFGQMRTNLGSLSLAATGSMIVWIMITISGLLHKRNMSGRATTSDQPPRKKLEHDYGWERWCSSPLNEGNPSPGLPNQWAYSSNHCSYSDQEGEFCDKITVSISCFLHSVWRWTGVKTCGELSSLIGWSELERGPSC